MAKLTVTKLSETQINHNGVVYEKADHPVQVGDIVQCNESISDLTYGGFYAVTKIDDWDEFEIMDDVNDERERSVRDEDFVPYRKVLTNQPVTITIDQPVHLIITNVASIEFKTVEVSK